MTTIRPRLVAVLLGSLLLAATACGTDDDSAETDAAPTEDSATEDSATEDSATEDSATEDSATEDSATEDSATEDSATGDTAVAAGEAGVEDVTYPVTVISCGEEVVVEARPERVIPYTDAHTELFVALGLADVVVGEIWDFEALVRPENEEAVRAVEALATDSWPSREQVAALEPDFIFANAFFFDSVAPVEDFESIGAVAYLPADGCPEPPVDVFAGQIADIENLGLIFGVQDRADELVEELSGGLDELTAALAGVEPTPVLWVDYVFDDDRGVQLIASEFYAETVGLGGGELLLAGRDDTPSQEQVVAAQPEVVFITDIYGRTGYETTPQERSEQVFALLTNAPATAAQAWAPMPITPRTAIGYVDQIRAVANVLHPDAL